MACCKRINHDYYKFKYDFLVLRSHHALASFHQVHGCVKSKKFLRRPLNSSVVLVLCCIFHGTRRVLPPTNAEEEEACVVHDTQLSLPTDVQRERKENRSFQGESTERTRETLLIRDQSFPLPLFLSPWTPGLCRLCFLQFLLNGR